MAAKSRKFCEFNITIGNAHVWQPFFVAVFKRSNNVLMVKTTTISGLVYCSSNAHADAIIKALHTPLTEEEDLEC